MIENNSGAGHKNVNVLWNDSGAGHYRLVCLGITLTQAITCKCAWEYLWRRPFQVSVLGDIFRAGHYRLVCLGITLTQDIITS